MSTDQVITNIVEKITFANYLPLLTRATADNKDVTLPGYMLTEIEKLSYNYPHHCNQLVAYLSRRLEKPSANVKLKVLKIFEHLIKEGHVNIRIELRKHDSAIKVSTMYHGIADPLTGTTSYETIRTNSKDILNKLYDPEKILEDEKELLENKSKPEKPFLGALGSSSNTSDGKYQGFGNSPIVKEESVAEKVLNYFDKLTASNDQNSKIIREGIASSVGNYEAVKIPNQQQQFLFAVPKPMPSLPPQPKPNIMKAHTPGKAGGGWEDTTDDDEEEIEKIASQHESNSIISAEDSLEMNEVPINENIEEIELIRKFCDQNKFPISWEDLSDTCNKCSELSSSQVIKALANEIKNVPSIQALTLLDGLIHTDTYASKRNFNELSNIFYDLLNKIEIDDNLSDICKNKARKIFYTLKSRQEVINKP